MGVGFGHVKDILYPKLINIDREFLQFGVGDFPRGHQLTGRRIPSRPIFIKGGLGAISERMTILITRWGRKAARPWQDQKLTHARHLAKILRPGIHMGVD